MFLVCSIFLALLQACFQFFSCMTNVETALAWTCSPCHAPDHILPLPYELLLDEFTLSNFSSLHLILVLSFSLVVLYQSNFISPTTLHCTALAKFHILLFELRSASCRLQLPHTEWRFSLITWYASPVPLLPTTCSSRRFISHIFTFGSWELYYRSVLIYWLVSCYCFDRRVLVYCTPTPALLSCWFITSVWCFSTLQMVTELQVQDKPCLMENSRILVVDIRQKNTKGIFVHK